jgi:hypothetical protein
MPITFEPTGSFGELPEKDQDLSRHYLIGEDFASLDEALRQEYEPGHSLDWHGFTVGDIIFKPKNLPVSIKEVEICVRVCDGERYELIPALRARYSE